MEHGLAANAPDENGSENAANRPKAVTCNAYFRNADFAGAAVSSHWKASINNQGVKNYEKIIWAK